MASDTLPPPKHHSLCSFLDPTAFRGNGGMEKSSKFPGREGRGLATLNLLDLCWPGRGEEAEGERNLGSFGVQE